MDFKTAGEQAIGYWQARASLPFDLYETILRLRGIDPLFPERLGKAIVWPNLSGDQVRSSMERLAVDSAGYFPQKPVDLQAFYDSLLGEVTGVRNWVRIAEETAAETGEVIVKAAAFGLGTATIVAIVAVLVFALAKGKAAA